MEKKVVLVDEQDRELGVAGKIEAHEKALLHRAFSIFLFNKDGQMLLQQRAHNKYHSAGLWSNACCSHPEPNEPLANAAARRLREELGIETKLEKLFDFVYRAEFSNGLTEYEFDHVFVGESDTVPTIDPQEVVSIRFANMPELEESIRNQPAQYTTWFKLAFPEIMQWWRVHYRANKK